MVQLSGKSLSHLHLLRSNCSICPLWRIATSHSKAIRVTIPPYFRVFTKLSLWVYVSRASRSDLRGYLRKDRGGKRRLCCRLSGKVTARNLEFAAKSAPPVTHFPTAPREPSSE